MSMIYYILHRYDCPSARIIFNDSRRFSMPVDTTSIAPPALSTQCGVVAQMNRRLPDSRSGFKGMNRRQREGRL